jgi:hypothetical protein
VLLSTYAHAFEQRKIAAMEELGKERASARAAARAAK